MRIEEYYDSGSADKSDSLMVVVKNYRAEQKHLADLKSQTFRFLVPVATDNGFMPQFDPAAIDDIKRLYGDIEASGARCEDLFAVIQRIDEVVEKYSIERPILREIQSDIVMHKRFLNDDQEVIAATLSHLLLELRDERKARSHPDYKNALLRSKESKKRHEPQIARLEKAVAELEAILSEGTGSV